jgi:hypothetical protein
VYLNYIYIYIILFIAGPEGKQLLRAAFWRARKAARDEYLGAGMIVNADERCVGVGMCVWMCGCVGVGGWVVRGYECAHS